MMKDDDLKLLRGFGDGRTDSRHMRERMRENLFCLFTNYHNSFNRQKLRITYQYILQ